MKKLATRSLMAATLAAVVLPAATAASTLPIYPGAAHVEDVSDKSCGTNLKSSLYQVTGSWQPIATWYQGHMSGAIPVRLPGLHTGVVEIFSPDGREMVAVIEDSSTPVVSLNAFDPPLSSDRIAQIKAASRGDAAAKAQLKAECANK